MGNSLSTDMCVELSPAMIVAYSVALGMAWAFGFFYGHSKDKSIQSPVTEKSEHTTSLISVSTNTIDSKELDVVNNASSEQSKRRTYIQKEGIIVPIDAIRRGQLWSKHPSWQLTSVAREQTYSYKGIEHVVAILRKFDIDPFRGFLPSQDPLQRLQSTRYHIWEDLADDLPKLLGARLGQAREPLRRLPVLSTDKLVTHEDLRRAHLLLCLFAHAYIWGGPEPMDEIPQGIAIPLWDVSKRLDIPPVLGYASLVLYNWRRLDENAAISMNNLSTLNNFFDGRDESWFYLITVEIEARGAKTIRMNEEMAEMALLAQQQQQNKNSIEDEEETDEENGCAAFDIDTE
eukprot:gene10673-22276_t